jgi:hypothetical protein
MARRRLIWHIGLADAPRSVMGAGLEAHADSLLDLGVDVSASSEGAGLATHELLRTHRQAGLSRSHVEGRWARICDRVWQHRGISLLSTPDLCSADKDQIDLALDALKGIEVHLVLTLDSCSAQLYGGWLAELRTGRSTGWEKYVSRVVDSVVDSGPDSETDSGPGHAQAERFWAGHDVPALLTRWGWTLHPERLHVLASPDPVEQWCQLLDVVGVASEGLAAVVPAYADPARVAVLRRLNRQLEEPLGPGTVELFTAPGAEAAAMPVAPTSALLPVLERWADELAQAGHDVRGDLASLAGREPETALPGARDQLDAALDVIAEGLAENSRLRRSVADLEADREHLRRKRRKLRRRLEQARAEGSRQN